MARVRSRAMDFECRVLFYLTMGGSFDLTDRKPRQMPRTSLPSLQLIETGEVDSLSSAKPNLYLRQASRDHTTGFQANILWIGNLSRQRYCSGARTQTPT